MPSPLPLQDVNHARGSSRSRPGRGCRCRSRPPRSMSACSPREARSVCSGGEIPPALIGQDGDVAGVDVGDGQVEAAVVLEVALGDRDRGLARPGSARDRVNVPSPLPMSTTTSSVRSGAGDRRPPGRCGHCRSRPPRSRRARRRPASRSSSPAGTCRRRCPARSRCYRWRRGRRPRRGC